ncbi:MAG: pantetheine-phosphate adenylyltransferase [Ilumatobacteraceae bacterium]|nr:pantetheine-phosphate adenylyltransferase [Ilumatobacteraceae bacterium]MBL6759232.1 pantetheine-phosphate adenylyltransferase [Ilumatobacteraceae bacterium]
MGTVLVPGSFDPMHLGHLDVVDQAIDIFGDVVVAVMHNPSKPSGLFDPDERVALAVESLGARTGVRVEAFGALAVDAAQSVGAEIIVKGLRNGGDFEIEQQMAHNNIALTGVRTVFVPCRADLSHISSRFVREIASAGRPVEHLVPPPVAAALAGRFGGR